MAESSQLTLLATAAEPKRWNEPPQLQRWSLTSQLKCDGQKQGCFRCNASSIRCSYTRYSNKRERQRKYDANQRTRSVNKTHSQNQISNDQRRPSEGNVQATGVSQSIADTSCHPMGDDQSFQHENARDRNILSPDSIRELDVEDEQLLFDGLLPNSVPNSGPQGEDPFTLEFSHSNADGNMNKSMTPLDAPI